MSKIICIGRQFGSGGHRIAKQVAENLGIPYFDKEILAKAAELSGLPEKILENAEERTANPLLFKIYYEGNLQEHYGKNVFDIIYEVEKQIILETAAKGDCVFVGRCAGEILKKETDHNVLNVFVAAPMEYRIENTIKTDGLSEKSAADKIRKMDKARKTYHNYYTGKDWGKPSDYDMMFNSAELGDESIVRMLCKLYESR